MKILPLYSPNIFIIKEKINFVKFLEHYDLAKVLFIVTPAVQKYISFLPKQGDLIIGYSLFKEDLDKKMPELQNIVKIVVVGASKILDQSKYIAARLNIPLIAIPSILSTNAFSTERAVLKVNGKITSVEARVPDEVYIIDSLLDMAPKKYNRFGLIDVLSMYTAVQDWDIAIADKKASFAVEYYLAKAILEAFYLNQADITNYYDVAKFLLHSGLVVGMYGEGRPESGSEHIIAKAIESKINCFHAYSVSFGMLAAMKLQNSWREDIAALAKNIPDWKSDYGKNILVQIEKNLSYKDIKPRPGRYTILDKVNSKKIESVIKEVVKFLKA